MATAKNRGVFRAQGIGDNITKDEFKSALDDLLTAEELQTFTLIHLQLVPTCHDSRTQVAIFQYGPGPPWPCFLSIARPFFQLDGRDVLIDSDFHGLTQLYPVDPDSAKIE